MNLEILKIRIVIARVKIFLVNRFSLLPSNFKGKYILKQTEHVYKLVKKSNL